MIHFTLFIISVLVVELCIRSNYINLIYLIIKKSKKAINLIFNNKISDHWKEKIIPLYSLDIFKLSFQILLIFLSMVFIFLIVEKFFASFISFAFSLNGIIEYILLR